MAGKIIRLVVLSTVGKNQEFAALSWGTDALGSVTENDSVFPQTKRDCVSHKKTKMGKLSTR